MCKIISFLPIFSLFLAANAHYSGPFLLWGIDDLRDIEVSALEGIEDKILRDLYSNAGAVVIFLRNGTTKLNAVDFQKFKDIIDGNGFLYLPQQYLTSDPLDYNVNAEVINLVGTPTQQDTELSALFRDSVNTYGDKKVLGILANRWDEHEIHKREAPTDIPMPSTTPSPNSEDAVTDSIYMVKGKAILYTTSPPVLRTNFSDDDDATVKLETHILTTYDERSEQVARLFVTFLVNETKIKLGFGFDLDSTSWCLSKVDVSFMSRISDSVSLDIEGTSLCATIGQSFKCSQQVIFRNGSNSLVLENIQVQPVLNGAEKFGSAQDCVGFMTAPIWSGIFVTSIILIVMSLAISAILDIKPPNRFESRTGKPLTFTIQE